MESLNLICYSIKTSADGDEGWKNEFLKNCEHDLLVCGRLILIAELMIYDTYIIS